MMAFGRDPSILHTQCKVRLARFEGTDKRIFRDQTVCEGNLFEQYDTIIDFCLKHLNIAGRMDSKYRQDTLTVPYEAIKEATINMICHRSWNYQNMTPSLAIYDDRMVFQNPGSFPIGMKWQDFLGDEIGSLPANPIIANVFYRRGIMEAWGRGIGLIIKSCKEQQLVKPEINVTQSFVNLTIWFKKSLTINHTPSHTPSYTPSYTPSHANNGDKIEFLSPQERVFKFCEEAKSITEISKMLGVNDKKWVRKKYLTPYIGTIIQLTIPDKPNSRNQKYVTINKSI